jgi:hypothetical protein
MPICQLFYVSSVTDPVDGAVIQHILQGARRNNRQLDITGCLLYSGRYFAQILEGRKEQVQALARRIASDPRHRNVRIVLENHRIDRAYADWSMGYLHDCRLEDSLEGLLLEGGEPRAIADAIARMKPDTIMGPLA